MAVDLGGRHGISSPATAGPVDPIAAVRAADRARADAMLLSVDSPGDTASAVDVIEY